MFFRNVRVGLFLAKRHIRGANKWSTSLIVFVMLLTFLNLVVISGVLEGIVVGSIEGVREKGYGAVYISPREGLSYIERSQSIERALKSDSRVESFAARYQSSVNIISEKEFSNVANERENRKVITSSVYGVDPEIEKQVIGLDKNILEGSYFSKNSNSNEILIGSALLSKYSPFGDFVLEDVEVGDFVYISFSNRSISLQEQTTLTGTPENSEDDYKKYKIIGVFRTKVGELDVSLIMNRNEVRLTVPQPGNNATSIAVRLTDFADADAVRDALKADFSKNARIETPNEYLGTFLDDIRTVFRTIGNIVGAIGLIVSSITIFIIIFVTATSREKYIGILKAIGLSPNSIKISYILYAMFFAVLGTTIGLILLFVFIAPFFAANPIPFPFSDGVLYVTKEGLFVQISLILISTFFAGLIPASRVIKKPAIDSVRGR